MLTRLLDFLGLVLVIIGVIDLVRTNGGVGWALIVAGAIIILFAEFVLGGGFGGRPVRGSARGRL